MFNVSTCSSPITAGEKKNCLMPKNDICEKKICAKKDEKNI